jgi:hypothetical protein
MSVLLIQRLPVSRMELLYLAITVVFLVFTITLVCGGRFRLSSPSEKVNRMDLLYLAITVLFFALTLALVYGCDHLGRSS